ncbi:MAG: transporter [Eubacteriales bacterium]|nr:transporter [Eubacteriales bacterium]
MKPDDVLQSPAETARFTRVPAKDFLLLHATLLLYAVASVFAKAAGVHLGAREMTAVYVFLALEMLALGVYAALWQQTLKRMPLSFAYSNKGVCTLWMCLAGLIFFGESMTLGKALGILVVLCGVWLVVSDHE